jgi:hypothetical protein
MKYLEAVLYFKEPEHFPEKTKENPEDFSQGSQPLGKYLNLDLTNM